MYLYTFLLCTVCHYTIGIKILKMAVGYVLTLDFLLSSPNELTNLKPDTNAQ